MAYPVYSVRFMNHSGPTNVFGLAVPAGRRWVIRNIVGANNDSAEGSIWVSFAGVYSYRHVLPGRAQGFSDELRVVLYAGESLGLELAGNDMRCTISGFDFQDPGGGLHAAELPSVPVPPNAPPELSTPRAA